MMLFRVGQLPICVVLFLVGASYAYGETQLEKFRSAIPPQLSLAISSNDACALIAFYNAKNEAANIQFADIEAKIAKGCDEHLSWKHITRPKLLLPDTEIAALFSRYKALSQFERRLKFEGKPIPGYVESPETKRFLACDTKMSDAKSKYISCVDDAVIYLVPNSLDSSDVVADAAVGICSAQRAETVDSMACFGVDANRANGAVSELDRKLKSSALGKIAVARAEIARRRRQPPKVNNPSNGGI
jgi:hypothetical protein